MVCSIPPTCHDSFTLQLVVNYVDVYCVVCLLRICDLSYTIQAENTKEKQ